MRVLPVGPDHVRVGALASNPHPTDGRYRRRNVGQHLRCGTYVRIREAIKQAAQSNRQGG